MGKFESVYKEKQTARGGIEDRMARINGDTGADAALEGLRQELETVRKQAGLVYAVMLRVQAAQDSLGAVERRLTEAMDLWDAMRQLKA